MKMFRSRARSMKFGITFCGCCVISSDGSSTFLGEENPGKRGENEFITEKKRAFSNASTYYCYPKLSPLGDAEYSKHWDAVYPKLSPLEDAVYPKLSPLGDAVYPKLSPLGDAVYPKLSPLGDAVYLKPKLSLH